MFELYNSVTKSGLVGKCYHNKGVVLTCFFFLVILLLTMFLSVSLVLPLWLAHCNLFSLQMKNGAFEYRYSILYPQSRVAMCFNIPVVNVPISYI